MRGRYIWKISQEYAGTCYTVDIAGVRLVVLGGPYNFSGIHRSTKTDGQNVVDVRTPKEAGKWGGAVLISPMNQLGIYEFASDFFEFIDDCDDLQEAMSQVIRAYGRVQARVVNEVGHQLLLSTYNGKLPVKALDTLLKVRLELEDSEDRVRASSEPVKEVPQLPAPPEKPPRYQTCNYCGLQNRFHPPIIESQRSPVRLCNGNLLAI